MNDELIAYAKNQLEELLTFFGLNTTVAIERDGENVELQVPADLAGRLIGHHGETLRAIQHIVNMMVRAKTRERVYVSVDIAGYKQARAEALTAQALASADKAVSEGEKQELRPMTPAERRVVHMALAERSDVTTESAGEGADRRVVIVPVAK